MQFGGSGAPLQLKVGDVVGSSVGLPDGAVVGPDVGLLVGVVVGVGVGRAVGDAVGKFVEGQRCGQWPGQIPPRIPSQSSAVTFSQIAGLSSTPLQTNVTFGQYCGNPTRRHVAGHTTPSAGSAHETALAIVLQVGASPTPLHPMVGAIDGIDVGVVVGVPEGLKVGKEDGSAVGIDVGLKVGSPVGLADGAVVGVEVVGDTVGLWLGAVGD